MTPLLFILIKTWKYAAKKCFQNVAMSQCFIHNLLAKQRKLYLKQIGRPTTPWALLDKLLRNPSLSIAGTYIRGRKPPLMSIFHQQQKIQFTRAVSWLTRKRLVFGCRQQGGDMATSKVKIHLDVDKGGRQATWIMATWKKSLSLLYQDQ